MGPIGVPELVIIFVIALIVFGPKKLPDLGRSLGKSISEFKRASNELRNTLEEEVRLEEQKDQRKALASEVASATTSDAPAAVDLPATDPSMIQTDTADLLEEQNHDQPEAAPSHTLPGETVARGSSV
jgi:TatA/E family protein of Tat protein translocase